MRGVRGHRLALLVLSIWGGIAVLGMAAALAQGYGLLGGSPGDGFVLFNVFALAGLPAWLITGGLTASRWRNTPSRYIAVRNVPAVVAALLWLAARGTS